jgi:hypothetical protein
MCAIVVRFGSLAGFSWKTKTHRQLGGALELKSFRAKIKPTHSPDARRE